MKAWPSVRPSFYLRASLTPHCGFHCAYCQPAGPSSLGDPRPRLSADELEKAARALSPLGLNRIRLTGGEPLSRPDHLEVIRRLSGVDGIREVSLTTNGARLAGHADSLAAAGLRRVNVHLDTLRADRFTGMGGRGRHSAVLRGIRAARAAGLLPLKVNVVLMRGLNTDELADFCRFAIDEKIVVRFIELMDTGPARTFVRRHFFPVAEARRFIAQRFEITPRFNERGASPAREYLLDGGRAVVGFIAPETEPFCRGCNRLRLTAEGWLKRCLYDSAGVDLATMLTTGKHQALAETLEHFLRSKSDRPHRPDSRGSFSMAQVGG